VLCVHKVAIFSDSAHKDVLYNFLCFMQKLNFKVLLYHASENLTLKYHFDHATTLTFPAAKIWSTYSHKKMMYKTRDQWVGYKDELVIQNHGTGLKLFLLSEVLEYDYNAIFFDLDIGFVSDPMPHLWQGLAETPDVITSLEPLTCAAQANNPEADIKVNGRASYMPNSGTLMIRSTPAGKSFLTAWINATVEGNWFNEQYAFVWPPGYGMQPSESCNKLPSGLISGTENFYSSQPSGSILNPIKYCFLNKYLFQTGMILFGCRYQSYYGNISHAGLSAEMVLHQKGNGDDEVFFPVSVHVNARTPKSFKTKKDTLLKYLNLWILDSNSLATTNKPTLQCKSLDLASSRWVTKRFNSMWHSTWYFPDNLT
jgi:hypothetical protein